MKTLKKIALGSVFCLLVLGGLLFSPAKHAAAATPTFDDAQACADAKNLSFVDIAHIVCKTPDGDVTFLDVDPTDLGNGYNRNYASQDLFCTQQGKLGDSAGSYKTGITVASSWHSDRGLNPDDAGKPIDVILNLGYEPKGTTGCERYNGPGGGKAAKVTMTNTSGVGILFDFNSTGDSVSSFTDLNSGTGLAGWTYDLQDYNKTDLSKPYIYLSGDLSSKCDAHILIVKSGSPVSATSYKMHEDGKGVDRSKYPELFAYMKGLGGVGVGCGVDNLDSFDINGWHGGNFSITGTLPTAGTVGAGGSLATKQHDPCTSGANCVNGECNKDGGECTNNTSGTNNTCELQANGNTLAWLECPALEFIDVFATGLMRAFESQLPFCIAQNGLNCKAESQSVQSLGSGEDRVRAAWAIIRDLSSAVLVIVMLMMIISQAIGSGPFEAYTIRKYLPRMVAAVILMQLSWPLFAWAVDLVNDLGNGLSQILYAPFGGAHKMTIGYLLDNAGISTTGPVNQAKTFFLSWALGAVGFGLGVAALGNVFFGALVSVFSLIAGLLTLVFRKILIIALLIFSPLAIVLWMLPGQGLQKYWKLWIDNLIKVLMMYPLVVTIIASGRIFAYIAGATDLQTGKIGFADAFFKFWFVVIGYFLPLAILPRAYKWGGSMLAAGGNQIASLQRNAQNAAKQPVRDFAHALYTGKRADQYDPTKSPWGVQIKGKPLLFGHGPNWRPSLQMNGRAYRRIQSGHFLPTNRSRNLTLQTGTKWSTERTEEAMAYEQKVSRYHQDHGVSEKEANEWNERTKRLGYNRGDPLRNRETGEILTDSLGNIRYSNDIFKARPSGVGAGKWSALALYWKAYEEGDEPLKKAVGDHLIDSKSGLEYRDANFVAPYLDKNFKGPDGKPVKGGKKVIVPMFAHPTTIDRAYKDPGKYATLSSMGGDFPPHNTPYGGKGGQDATGYNAVYMRGIRYYENRDGTIHDNSDNYNPDIARTFEITIGQGGADGKDKTQFATRKQLSEMRNGKHYRKSAMAAHYAQASYDDARNNMAQGGSMGGAFMNALITGARKGFVQGEKPNDMPLKQACWVLIDATRTQQGRDSLNLIRSDPSTREIAERMFKTAGITKFKDSFDKEHEMSIENLWNVNTAAEEKIKDMGRAGASPPVAPGRHESMLKSDGTSIEGETVTPDPDEIFVDVDDL